MRAHLYRLAVAGGVAVLGYGVSLWSVAAALVIAGAVLAAAGLAGLYGVDATEGRR